MIYRHTDTEISNYFANSALNQTSIKVILNKGIQAFVEQQEQLLSVEEEPYEEKEHFIVGSAVDCIITGEEGAFDRKYAYSNLIHKPSDAIMTIVQKVFREIPEDQAVLHDILSYKRELYDSCNDNNYYMSRKVPSEKLIKGKPDERTWEEDKRVENFMGDGTVAKYWEELINSKGKQLLSEYENNKIVAVSDSFKNHQHTRNLFTDGDNVDIIYQMPLFFTLEGVLCKALLDMIRINHRAKKIMPIDLKTMGDYVLRFNQSLRRNRYDIQGAFYTTAVSECLNTIGKLIGKDISDYEVSNFAFIVESTTKPGTPMIYVMDDTLTDSGKIGSHYKTYIGGYEQGILLYKDWSELNYSIEDRFKDTNGVVWMNADFDYNETF